MRSIVQLINPVIVSAIILLILFVFLIFVLLYWYYDNYYHVLLNLVFNKRTANYKFISRREFISRRANSVFAASRDVTRTVLVIWRLLVRSRSSGSTWWFLTEAPSVAQDLHGTRATRFLNFLPAFLRESTVPVNWIIASINCYNVRMDQVICYYGLWPRDLRRAETSRTGNWRVEQ